MRDADMFRRDGREKAPDSRPLDSELALVTKYLDTELSPDDRGPDR